jgi:hypothetical protein
MFAPSLLDGILYIPLRVTLPKYKWLVSSRKSSNCLVRLQMRAMYTRATHCKCSMAFLTSSNDLASPDHRNELPSSVSKAISIHNAVLLLLVPRLWRQRLAPIPDQSLLSGIPVKLTVLQRASPAATSWATLGQLLQLKSLMQSYRILAPTIRCSTFKICSSQLVAHTHLQHWQHPCATFSTMLVLYLHKSRWSKASRELTSSECARRDRKTEDPSWFTLWETTVSEHFHPWVRSGKTYKSIDMFRVVKRRQALSPFWLLTF